MMKERLIRTIIISMALICIVGFMKPETDKTAYREKLFWILKTHSPELLDVIIVGDSRVYRGLSPEHMGKNLLGCRIFNFAYSAGSLGERMLSEAEKRLDPNGRKIIILGVTPLSLTPRSALDEQFLQEKNKDRLEVAYIMHLGQLNDFFAPFTKLLKTADSDSPEYHQEYHKDGWIASWMKPERPNEGLDSYAGAFTNNSVSAEIEKNLVARTADLVKRGYRVFAFRPPTCREMTELENRLSGFREEEFVKNFTAAGGLWIPVSNNDYHSYDCSHIDKESAIKLSYFIADRISRTAGSGVKTFNPPLSSRSP